MQQRSHTHNRRRSRFAPQICCAIASATLLLISVSLLHSRLSPTVTLPTTTLTTSSNPLDDTFPDDDPLLVQDTTDPLTLLLNNDDRIDELDDEEKGAENNEEEILRGIDSDGEEKDGVFERGKEMGRVFYFDHVVGVLRRGFDRRSIDEMDMEMDNSFDGVGLSGGGGLFGVGLDHDRSKVAFGSDDIPVDEEVRRKVVQVKGVEDALLLKLGSRVSPLREGWGPWFDAKSDFLRKDRMFRSNLELLNPLNNLLLQDPDGAGVVGLTRGDKLVQKSFLNEMKKVPFMQKKPLGISQVSSEEADLDHSAEKQRSSVSHSSLDKGGVTKEKPFQGHDDDQHNKAQNKVTGADYDASRNSVQEGTDNGSLKSDVKSNAGDLGDLGVKSGRQEKSDSSISMSARGNRWGYYPGLHPRLSFSNFMDTFFRQSKCSMRFFMVWNSPPWMYTVRYQRGLESVFFHHPDACVTVLSETLELNFFKDFQKEGFKIAVAMPNLEELLKDTPTSIFASVWSEWRTTRFYSTHYSELIRLAALYKYGGIYLDCDIILLKPISSFNNSVGLELSSGSTLNGAVMAFRKHSPFLKECLLEFYASYDDTLRRWNGADLLTRVAGNFSSKMSAANGHLELKVQPSSVFFPISSNDIQRYLVAPVEDSEKAHQDALFRKILDDSYTFHFWNSITAALIPEPDSLVARTLDRFCSRCFDVL